MSWTYPLGLAFLFALPLILWLHLRRRRPRRIVVPALTPWLALPSAAPPRRRRVPPTVLLAMHLAAASALALALAGPALRGTTGTAVDRAVVLDVTTSMGAGDRWSRALATARDLAAGTRGALTLVTLEARPRVLAARDADGRRAAAALARLEAGATGTATDEALALAAAVAGPSAEIVVVTDGAIARPGPGAPAARWEVVGPAVDDGSLDNLAVVQAGARSAGGQTRLFARVASFAAEAVAAPLALEVDGRVVDTRAVDLAPGGTFETVWTVPGGATTAVVRLDARDALAVDDAAIVPLERAGRRVQLVGDSPAVARALAAIPDARLERLGLATFHADGSVPASVFVGAVPDTLPPGGVVLFDPPPGRLFKARAADAEGRVAAVGGHPLVADLGLAGVRLAGLTDPEVPAWAEPVLAADGMTAALAGTFGASRLVVFAFDPDAGNLAGRLAFPLLVARALAWAAPEGAPAAVAAGDAIPLPPADALVQTPDGAVRRAWGQFDATRRPGLYLVTTGMPGSGRPERIAVRAGDLLESNLRRRADLPVRTESRPPGLPTTDAGHPLWPWLATFALALVMIESLWRARPSLSGRPPGPQPPPPAFWAGAGTVTPASLAGGGRSPRAGRQGEGEHL